MNPLVTIIIPTYKRPDFLKRAIDSVLNQTYKNIEIVIVDDNNPDTIHRKETEAVIRNYNDSDKIVYIQHEFNKNGSAARNTGIKVAQGEYIGFLDNDDEFLPEKIEKQINLMMRQEDPCVISYTSYLRKKSGTIEGIGVDSKEGYLYKDLLQGKLYISAGSNLLLHRDIISDIGFFDESFKRRQDLEFLIRASRKYKVIHVPEILLVIHRDDRENAKKLTIEEYIMNTNDFIEKFDYLISQFSPNDKLKVYQSQYLLLVRSLFLKGRFKDGIEIMKDNHISIFLFIRFIFYSFRRKITKKIYGFKI